MLRLWNKLILLDPDRLMYNVFINDYYMAQADSKNWSYSLYNIMHEIGCEDNFYNRQYCDINLCKNRLFELQEEKWKIDIQSKPKLRFYKTFKEHLTVENYVKYNLSPSERSCTAQLRAGILPLHIETGRFRNTKLENRLCSLCQLNEIEDEYHFLFSCSLYENARTNFVDKIKSENTEFENLDITSKLKVMFNMFPRCTSKFILKCFMIRKNKLYVL